MSLRTGSQSRFHVKPRDRFIFCSIDTNVSYYSMLNRCCMRPLCCSGPTPTMQALAPCYRIQGHDVPARTEKRSVLGYWRDETTNRFPKPGKCRSGWKDRLKTKGGQIRTPNSGDITRQQIPVRDCSLDRQQTPVRDCSLDRLVQKNIGKTRRHNKVTFNVSGGSSVEQLQSSDSLAPAFSKRSVP
jgi:hypothetical protein